MIRSVLRSSVGSTMTAAATVLVAGVALSPAAMASTTDGTVATAANRYVCGNYCDGKSPYTTFWDDYNHVYYKCATDAVTIDSIARNQLLIYLRYSTKCETAWTKVTNIGNVTGCATIESYYLNYTFRKEYSKCVSGGKGSYTVMVNDHNLLARSCEGASSYCTRMY